MLGLLWWLIPAAWAAGRHLTIIVDTSSSMQESDPRRYTLQLSQVLSDLLDTGDSLTVIRMPLYDKACTDRADPTLARQLDPADRSGFKQELDELLVANTGTYFAAPVRTASADLERHKDKARLLLIIADSGGLGPCQAILTRELLQLRDSGVMIAAINLGGAGAFDTNPAFAFTTGAANAEELVTAVAEVYQKFLGAKQVQTGRIQGTIEVEINPLVQEAFLVVVADGPIAGLEAGEGNPAAEQLDLDHRGGGHTLGLDGHRRDYRIVRLQRPVAGRWRFLIPNLSSQAGWMLLQDSALGLRLLSSPKVAQGVATPLEVELYDRGTGQRVTDTSHWPGLEVTLNVEGRTLRLRDDGQEGDRQAGDGILTGSVIFNQTGSRRVPLRLESDVLDRRLEVEFQVAKVDWLLQATVPARVKVSDPVTLSVQAQPNRGAGTPTPLQGIEVTTDGRPLVTLHDDGREGDKQPRDNLFTGVWTPEETGTFKLNLVPVGGGNAQPISVTVEVVGSIRFAPPIPVQFGRTGSNNQVDSRLDLGATEVKGDFPVEISSTYAATGSVLEIDLGQGWVPLDAQPKPLLLRQSGPRTWPLRLRVRDCPAGVAAEAGFSILLTGLDADNRPVRSLIPLAVEIIEDPWLHCWWPVLALGIGILLTGIVFYGFWSPSRFPPRLGVVLSPEEEMSEGFFHPIRAQRGSGSGFYRDARIYICQDFRLSGRARGALARLRAAGKQVRLQPTEGAQLLRRTLDDEWEPLPSEEAPVRFGTIYKDQLGVLFFEIRNG